MVTLELKFHAGGSLKVLPKWQCVLLRITGRERFLLSICDQTEGKVENEPLLAESEEGFLPGFWA